MSASAFSSPAGVPDPLLAESARAWQEGRRGDAIGRCLDLLDRSPAYAPGHLWLAQMLCAQGLPEAAGLTQQNLRALGADTADRWREAAAWHAAGDRLAEARAALDRAVPMAPADASLYYEAALLARAAGDAAAERRWLEQAVALAGAPSSAWIALGNLNEREQAPEAARACFEAAARGAPPHPDAALDLSLLADADSPPLYLSLPSGNSSGWGVCGRYLTQGLARRARVAPVEFADAAAHAGKRLPGTLFTAIADVSLAPTVDIAGRRTVGYTFFENELTARSVENARRYDLILAGSSWCVERLREQGITHTGLLVQGIDPAIFHPAPDRADDGRFVIFSGGKLELRKGQDLVLRAVAALQQKYPEVVLVTAWFNHWPQSMDTMAASTHIRYERRGADWLEDMHHLYRINGLDPARIVTHGVRPNDSLREVYAGTDIGLFPNRCEGGTNLVLMEYMACGRPAIATRATGHTDVLRDDNSLPLDRHRPYHLQDPQGQLLARWVEPDLDEIVARLEQAYHGRDRLRALGRRAAQDMAALTWQAAADRLYAFLRDDGGPR
jgi:glycosyltransferase involved in cell wall biosynthesis